MEIIKENNRYLKKEPAGAGTVKQSISLDEIIDLLIAKGVITNADLVKLSIR